MKKYVNNEPTMRDLLKITRTRRLVEVENKKNVYDQGIEEEKFLNNFRDMNVHVRFFELIVTDNYVLWGGTINGVIQFAYSVTDDKTENTVKFNYLEDFSPDNPENDEIVTRIEAYYDEFFKYWNENVVQAFSDEEGDSEPISSDNDNEFPEDNQ